MINMQTRDVTLTCSECGQDFTFTANEQQSYGRRGQSQPKQCAFCRAAGMIASPVRTSTPAHTSERAMYPAVCSDCGRQTTVPFEPRGSRPVYCSHCYQNHTATTGSRYDRDGRRPDSYSRR